MPWAGVADYNTNPTLNGLINGNDISEGSAAAGYNNALRQIMADIAAWTAVHGVTYPISIANGGTGQITANAAFNALAAAGGTVTGTLKQATKGSYPFWGSTSLIGGQMYLQAVGADPTVNPGDIVFEY
jgi:hypothetical protein